MLPSLPVWIAPRLATLLAVISILAAAPKLTAQTENTASAQVGVSFTTTFAVTGLPKSVGSYKVSGLPSGLSVPGAVFSAGTNTYSLNAPFGAITGTPTMAGSFALIITAAELPEGAGMSRAYNYNIAVSPAANSAPIIMTHPVGQTVNAGGVFVLSAAVSGIPTPTCQWRKDGVDISGATTTSYAIASVAPGDEGSYAVVATNPLGAVTSNIATLSVIVAPSNATVSIDVD